MKPALRKIFLECLIIFFYKITVRQVLLYVFKVDGLLKTHDCFDKLNQAIHSGCAEIAEKDLLELIERSREVHYERAPILFYPKWRSCLAPVRIGAKGTVELPYFFILL